MSSIRRALAAFFALTAIVMAGCRANARSTETVAPDAERLRSDVAYLASDLLEGRGTGTAGNDTAAAWLARRFASLGLQAPVPDYLQRFTARPSAHGPAGPGLTTQNVLAVLPGRDPALRAQVVVVGAHFDHLGRAPGSSLDPDAGSAIRNGADDNASGTAAVLELARLLRASPPRRSVVFALFSAEELGIIGSQYLVANSPIPVDSMVAMVNLDMVGRLRDRKLIVYGVETARELRALVDSANGGALDVRGVGDGFGPSDHSSFYGRRIPVLHLFTDLHDDYHRATDDVEKVNAQGMAQVVAFTERVIRRVADRPSRLTYVASTAPARTAAASARTGPQPSLGTVPDMSASDVPGLRLSAVRSGSPGDLAGLRAGDVIVEFGGTKITDLQSYSDALYARKPGDDVRIVVLRAGRRVTVTARLGQR
jgi:aminopeptidase YwaD